MSAGLSGRTGRPVWMGVGGGPGRDGFRDRGLVLVKAAEGWWFQIARRLIWVTSDTTDEGRLLELLLDGATTSDEVVPLVATEPILIAAPMTHQPVAWAFTARIWTDEVQRPKDRPWGILAKAIHGHGVPTITVDAASTPRRSPAKWSRRDTGTATSAPTSPHWQGPSRPRTPNLYSAFNVRPLRRPERWAVAMLLEQLVRPGFDPAQGAEATRRYVAKRLDVHIRAVQARLEKHDQTNPPPAT